jgi:hypothetical protein
MVFPDINEPPAWDYTLSASGAGGPTRFSIESGGGRLKAAVAQERNMPHISLLLVLLLWSAISWVIWKFYRAVSMIRADLAEIKVILKDRNNPPTAPSP